MPITFTEEDFAPKTFSEEDFSPISKYQPRLTPDSPESLAASNAVALESADESLRKQSGLSKEEWLKLKDKKAAAERGTPLEQAKGMASGAVEGLMKPLGIAGRVLNAAAQDIAAAPAALAYNDESVMGNLKTLLTPGRASDENAPLLPYEENLKQLSPTNPYLASAGKTAAGMVESLPMMAAGMPEGAAGKAVTAKFLYDMTKGGSEAAGNLYAELQKPKADRDMDLITSNVAELVTAGVFIPGMAIHGAQTKKGNAIRAIARQLKEDVHVDPTDYPSIQRLDPNQTGVDVQNPAGVTAGDIPVRLPYSNVPEKQWPPGVAPSGDIQLEQPAAVAANKKASDDMAEQIRKEMEAKPPVAPAPAGELQVVAPDVFDGVAQGDMVTVSWTDDNGTHGSPKRVRSISNKGITLSDGSSMLKSDFDSGHFKLTKSSAGTPQPLPPTKNVPSPELNPVAGQSSVSDQINKRKWWHVKPKDTGSYLQRGKFLASSEKDAEFYSPFGGAPVGESASVSNPLVGDEAHIETTLLGERQSDKLPEPESSEFYKARTALDRKLAIAAANAGFDSIALLSPKGFQQFKETGKVPKSVELNTLSDLNREAAPTPVKTEAVKKSVSKTGLNDSDGDLFSVVEGYGKLPAFIPDGIYKAQFLKLQKKWANGKGILTSNEKAQLAKLRKIFPPNYEDVFGVGGEKMRKAYDLAKKAGIAHEIFRNPIKRVTEGALDNHLGFLKNAKGKDFSPDDIWNMVEGAALRRLKGESPEIKEPTSPEEIAAAEKEYQAKDFELAASESGNGIIEQKAKELDVDDEFQVDGEWLRVTSKDAKTGDLIVEDGRRFGVQKVDGKETLYVEKLHQPEEAPKPVPTPTPTLKRGENQGDFIGGDVFNLAGEQGVDADRIAKEKADKEAKAKANEELHKKNQLELGAKEEVAPAKPTLIEYAKSKLPNATADKITSESQVESFRSQYEKDYPSQKPEPAPAKAEAPAELKPGQLTPELAGRLLKLSHEAQTDAFGPRNEDLRVEILTALNGKRPAKSSAGAKATQQAIAKSFGIDVTKLAGVEIENAIREKLTELRDGKPPDGDINSGNLGKSGMGGAKPSEFERGSGSPTAMKYRLINQERQKRGLEPLVKPESVSDQALMDRAMAEMDNNASAADDLVADIIKKPTTIEPWQRMLLLLRKIDLREAYNRSAREAAQAYDDSSAYPDRKADMLRHNMETARISKQLSDLEKASRLSGSETGRALRALRIMANEDYSLAGLETGLRASNNGKPITDAARSKLKQMADEYEKANTELKAALDSSRASELQAIAELDRMVKENKPVEPHVRLIADKVKGYFDQRAEAALKRLKGKTFTLSPEVLADLADLGVSKILSGGIKAGEMSAEWASEMVAATHESIAPHLKRIWALAQKSLDAKVQQMAGGNSEKVKRAARASSPDQKISATKKVIQERIEGGKKDSATPMVQKLARLLIESGVTDREQLITAVHDFLKEIDPEFTRRETMDAISGYGDFRMLSKDEISTKLRGLKGEMQQLAKIDDMAAGVPPSKTGIERRTPTEEERRLIKLVNEAKIKFQVPITDPARQLKSALDTRKTQLENRIKDLEERIANGDFAKKQRRELKVDRRVMELTAKREEVVKKFNTLKREYEMANRSTKEKIFDFASNARRFLVLSGVHVLGKLAAYSATKVPTMAATEIIGGGLSKMPYLKQIAAKAPSEGGLSLRAMSHSLAQGMTQGFVDAYKTMMVGHSDIKSAFSRRSESERAWFNFFQSIHEVIKSPLRRTAFELSLAKRIEHAAKNGVDTTDPLIQMALAKEAFMDSDRALLLENTRLASSIRGMMKQWEQPDKNTGEVSLHGKLAATVGRLELPILSVPINYANQTLISAFGLVSGTVKARAAFRRGIETLKPEEADAIMRHLKYGTIGGAMLLYGFYDGWNHADDEEKATFGGYYQPGEKRKKNQAGVGGMKIGGYKIDGFLLHNPILAVGQLGHTMGAVAHSKVRKSGPETHGLTVGVLAGMMGLLNESPLGRQVEVISSLSDPRSAKYATGEHVKGILIPQLSNEIARYTDKDWNGETIKRDPKTMLQHIETGIPGLRQTVPKKEK